MRSISIIHNFLHSLTTVTLRYKYRSIVPVELFLYFLSDNFTILSYLTLFRNMKIILIDCDTINHPSQLGLLFINIVFLKIFVYNFLFYVMNMFSNNLFQRIYAFWIPFKNIILVIFWFINMSFSGYISGSNYGLSQDYKYKSVAKVIISNFQHVQKTSRCRSGCKFEGQNYGIAKGWGRL